MALPVYVINLDRRPDRMATMAAQLEGLGLPFKRIRAVDANALSGADGVHKPPYMDLGARACLLSHGEALKSFQETDQPAALILEDDVELARDLPKLCESVEWWADKTPLVKLDIARSRAKLMGRIVGEAPGGRAMRPIIRWTAGAGAYLVARSISGEVLDAYEKADMPVDHILFDHRMSELPRRFRPVLLDPAAACHPTKADSDLTEWRRTAPRRARKRYVRQSRNQWWMMKTRWWWLTGRARRMKVEFLP